MSSFQALATALSGTIGIGSIAGVALSISLGGPGAAFWIFFGAILGMSIKFIEASLAVKYRRFNLDGTVSGGPMHYIAHGLTRRKMRWLGQPLSVLFDLRNVLLHISVPVMSIIDHLLNCPKGELRYKHAPIFLIYPLAYFIMVNLRAIFSTKRFNDGSLYPYFFLDPYLDGQGWGMVAIYLAVICLIFVGLAMLYIFLDKKLANRKNKKS